MGDGRELTELRSSTTMMTNMTLNLSSILLLLQKGARDDGQDYAHQRFAAADHRRD